MSTRTFDIELHGTATVEIDDAVIAAVDDDWRSSLYNLHTPEEIAQHIAFNLIVNGIHLSSMDGWADQDNSKARTVGTTDWTIEAVERR